MKIWKLDFELEEYENLIPKKSFTFEEIISFDGRKHLENWKPLSVKRMEPEKGLELGDAPGFTLMPVLSERAVNCLLPLIRENVEILSLGFDEGEYFGVNTITVLEALDYGKSEYRTFRDGKRIMVIEEYVFIAEKVKDVPIFKIVDEKERRGFVSDEFKRIVEENELKGFKFELAWDSECGQ